MEQLLRECMARHGLPDEASQTSIVAVSGGPDSMVLLDVAARGLRAARLEVLHIDHGLRPEEAPAEWETIRRHCEALGVPAHRQPLDPTLFEEAGRSPQMIARDARRRLLLKHLGGRPGAILLAHHQDDQAETLLLRLGRGTGLDGLSGMDEFGPGPFLRPFLGVTKAHLLAYARDHSIPFCTDSSNTEREYLRNRIRLDVLPTWEEALGHDPRPLLARAAALLREDAHFIAEHVRRADESLRLGCGSWYGGWQRQGLASEADAIASRLIRQEYFRIVGDWKKPLEAEPIARVLASARGEGPSRLALPNGVEVHIEPDGIWLAAPERLRTQVEPVILPDGTQVIRHIHDTTCGGARVIVRGRRRQLRDWLRENGVPVFLRPRLPRLVDNSGLTIWIDHPCNGGIEHPLRGLVRRI